MFGIEWNAQVIGWCCGGALVSLEVASIVATTAFRQYMVQHMPRLHHHLAIGAKTTSYRCFAGLDTFLISFLVTGHAGAASAVVGFELMTKFGLYYGHEWLWNRPFLRRYVNAADQNKAAMH